MNSSVALRLMWKEYRVHRGLWLSLLIGIVIFQILFWLFDLREMAQVATGTGWVLAICFAVASSGSTFAVQREEGSHLRMVLLSGSPALTAIVPVLTSVAGCLLLVLSGMVSAGLIAGFDKELAYLREFTTADWGMLGALTVMAAISGCFFSLVMPGPLSAVVSAAVFFIIAGTVVPANLDSFGTSQLDRLDALTNITLFTLTLILVFIPANWFAARWWMNRCLAGEGGSGFFSRFSWRQSLREALRGIIVDEAAVQTEHLVLKAEAAIKLPAPRRSLQRLLAKRCSQQHRDLKFLMWKERTESRVKFLWLLLPLLLLTGFFSSAAAAQHHPAPGETLCAFAMLLSLGCGFLSFRQEHAREQWQWLTNHGLGTQTVWLSKQWVWVPRLLIGPLAITGVASCAAREWVVLQPQMFFHDSFYFAYSMSARVLTLPLALLAFFVMGQACSVIIKRTVVSLAASWAGFALTMFHLAACVSLGVPVWLSVTPLSIGLLVATWQMLTRWLRDGTAFKRKGFPVPLAPMLSLLVAFVISLSGTFASRVLEIPVVAGSTLSPERMAELSRPNTAEELETLELYHEVYRLTRTIDQSELSELSREDSSREELQRVLDSNRQALSLIRKAAAQRSCALEATAIGEQDWVVSRTPYLLLSLEARNQAQQGQIREALETHRLMLRTCLHQAQAGSGLLLNFSPDREREILQSLCRWATLDSVTSELIAEARQMVLDHFAALPTLTDVKWREYRRKEALLDLPVSRQLELLSEDTSQRAVWGWRLLQSLPGESARGSRLLRWEEYRHAQLGQELTQAFTNRTPAVSVLERAHLLQSTPHLPAEVFQRAMVWNGMMFTPDELNDWKMQRAMATTPLVRRISGGIDGNLQLEVERVLVQRAGLTALALIEHWRRDGGLPATLPNAASIESTNPWTGRSFGWYSKGLQASEVEEGSEIPIGVPFLFIDLPSMPQLAEVVSVEGGSGMPGGAGEPMLPTLPDEPIAVPEALIPISYQPEQQQHGPTPPRRVFRLQPSIGHAGWSPFLRYSNGSMFWMLPARTLQPPGPLAKQKAVTRHILDAVPEAEMKAGCVSE